MNERFICPQNPDHGRLIQSKENSGAYRCYKCQGFACWDRSELNRSMDDFSSAEFFRKLREEMDGFIDKEKMHYLSDITSIFRPKLSTEFDDEFLRRLKK